MIRKAKISDAKYISKLIRENIDHVKENLYNKEETMAWKKLNTPKKIEEKINQKEIFVAVDKNNIIGTISLDKNLIGGFFVNSKLRGKGVGSKLFDFIIKYAKKKGLKKVSLTSSPSAKKFYEKRGFKSKGTYYYKLNNKISLKETEMIKKL